MRLSPLLHCRNSSVREVREKEPACISLTKLEALPVEGRLGLPRALISRVPQDVIRDVADEVGLETCRSLYGDQADKVTLPKHLVHQCPNTVDILVPDLHE